MSELTTGITMLCLLQLGVIVGCTLFTRTMVNFYRFHYDDFPNADPVPVCPAFIAYYGLWFMLVPLGCALAFVWKPADKDGEPTSRARIWVHCAWWSVVLLWLFFGTACQSSDLILSSH